MDKIKQPPTKGLAKMQHDRYVRHQPSSLLYVSAGGMQYIKISNFINNNWANVRC